MGEQRAGLAGHPDRERWNARYGADFSPSFTPHPLAEQALSLALPDGPVADLACGPSGSALRAAASGRQVEAVDVSDAALGLLREEAERRGVAGLIRLVHADLHAWQPDPGGYALVLCTGYWDSAVFAAAAASVRPGGLLAWEAFTEQALAVRPSLPAQWRLGPGEPATVLPGEYEVLGQQDAGEPPGVKRRLLARRV